MDELKKRDGHETNNSEICAVVDECKLFCSGLMVVVLGIGNQEVLEFWKKFVHLARVILSTLKHVFFTFCYERTVFSVWISCAKVSEFAGILPRIFVQFRHLGVQSVKADPESRKGVPCF